MVDYRDPMWAVKPIDQLPGRIIKEIVEIPYWSLGKELILIRCESGDLFVTGTYDKDKPLSEWMVYVLTVQGSENREWQEANREALVRILTLEQMNALDAYWAAETGKAEEAEIKSYKQRIVYFTERVEELENKQARRNKTI